MIMMIMMMMIMIKKDNVNDDDACRPAEDWWDEETDGYKAWVPSELKYLLNSFHMFGQFDPSLFADLYPSIETLRVTAGQYLFR